MSFITDACLLYEVIPVNCYILLLIREIAAAHK